MFIYIHHHPVPVPVFSYTAVECMLIDDRKSPLCPKPHQHVCVASPINWKWPEL